MFDILKDELVGLMIRLSGEYRDGIPAVRLSQSNMNIGKKFTLKKKNALSILRQRQSRFVLK